MKQISKLILVLQALLLPAIVHAHDFEVDGIYYLKNGNEATVTFRGTSSNQYSNEYSGEVIIPGTVAFNDTTYFVTSIGSNAFADCTGLTNVTIPNSVTDIGEYAFVSCTGLTSITIPNSVKIIGNSAFAGCTGLICIEIPNSVTSIEEFTFDSCSSLTSITIPNSVTSIGWCAFNECWNLSDLTFDNSVTSIAGTAFCGCTRLTRINITDLGAWCKNNFVKDFLECNDAHFQYNYHLFLNNQEVNNLVIPNSVTTINDWAFSGCSSLLSVVIPNSVTSIGGDAFASCQNLTKVSIPNSVTEIGLAAFYICKNLTDAFSYIVDPSLILPIENDDTWYWTSIWEVEEETDISERTLHVPSGSLEAYQSDWRWGELFGSIVEMDNHFEMPDTSVLYWETVTIPIVLSNDRNMLAFQTDIVLPEGFSIVTDEEDEYLIAPSNRLSSDHILMASDYGDGVVRVVCYTPESQPIDGYTGDLFYITVKVPENAAGDYPIILRNSRLTTEDYTELRIPDASSVINVKTYIPGDANNSRSVTVTDIVVTAQYVLGRNPQPFIFGAADMNGDGDVSVTDIMLIAYMLQHPSVNAPLRAPALTANNDRMSADAISLMPGETRTVNIMLDNDLDYSAFQLDLTLPEGLTASNFALTDRANGHTFDVCTIDDGRLRALCYSPTLATINGHKGALLTFDVTAMTHVTGDIIVDAIELVTNTSQTVDMGTFNIQVNNSSAVNEIVSGKTVARVEYYNVAGQQIAEPTSGLTIIVTTYTDGTRSTNKLHR